MVQNSRRLDADLTLPNGQHVTRIQYNAVVIRLHEVVHNIYLQTGERPEVKDLTNEVVVPNNPEVIGFEAHSDVYIGDYLKDWKARVIYLIFKYSASLPWGYQVAIKKLRTVKVSNETHIKVRCDADLDPRQAETSIQTFSVL